jgi:spore coat polysaccharide biosynthesis protein SpsF (cytidylyltransferase family)
VKDIWQKHAVFVQARMSSSRFPGKVLAPLHGIPVLGFLLNRLAGVVPHGRVFVMTSDLPSDDPVESYARSLEVPVIRGSLEDVLSRFQHGVRQLRLDGVFRVTADAPLVNLTLLKRMATDLKSRDVRDVDLMTSVHPRSFPTGRNLEWISGETLVALAECDLDERDREHVTRFVYRNSEQFGIWNYSTTRPELADTSLAVDELEDLIRLNELPSLEESVIAAEEGELSVAGPQVEAVQ